VVHTKHGYGIVHLLHGKLKATMNSNWQLVPINPTQEMCESIANSIKAGWMDSMIWTNVLDVAPLAPEKKYQDLTDAEILAVLKQTSLDTKWLPPNYKIFAQGIEQAVKEKLCRG
jgi:hypothetical protein